MKKYKLVLVRVTSHKKSEKEFYELSGFVKSEKIRRVQHSYREELLP